MNIPRIVGWIFAGVGTVFLAIGLFLGTSTRTFLAEAVQAQGTVIDLDRRRDDDGRTTFAPVVRFVTAEGETTEFVSSTSSTPARHARGDTVAVWYRPDAPASARLTGFFALWGGATIFTGLGGVLALAGGGLLVRQWRQRRLTAHLQVHGTRVATRFVAVEHNTGVSANGRHPYRIVTQWQDPATATLHLFHSPNLWFDPSDHLPAGPIGVWIDPARPRRHRMDVSFLPALAG